MLFYWHWGAFSIVHVLGLQVRALCPHQLGYPGASHCLMHMNDPRLNNWPSTQIGRSSIVGFKKGECGS